MKNTKQYYDQTPLEWLEQRKDDDSVIPMFKELMAYLPDNPRILDLCCGVGYDSDRLHKMGARVLGLDFSDECIRLAEKTYPSCAFATGNMLEDYTHLGLFDGCILLAGLVHLPNEQLKMAFMQLHKVLSKGALVLIVVKEGTGKCERMSLKTVDGESYDRAFYNHTLAELKAACDGLFLFENEFVEDASSHWKNYFFKLT